MSQWISQFDYPDKDGWMELATRDRDGAKRAAQEVADRGGPDNKRYAKAVYDELKVIWKGMRVRRAAPVVVYVPLVPLSSRPLVPISAYVQARSCPPEERSVEAIMTMLGPRTPERYGEADITAVMLPVGPACRFHELVVNEAGDDGRRFLTEHVDHFFLPRVCPDVMYKFSVTWSSLFMGPEMCDAADVMAASLVVEEVSE